MYEEYLTKAGIGFGVLSGSVLATEEMLLPKEPAEIQLDKKVSIHVPTLNEENYIKETLISLNQQPYYRFIEDTEIIVLDSYSEDNTAKIASQFADKVWNVSRGKLNARDEGIKRDDADIIVNVDAGAYYPPYWLSHLLKPFEREEVVATQGFTFAKDPLWKIPYLFSSSIRPVSHLSGHNSAIKVETYYNIGGFDLSVDQFKQKYIWKEEEILFLRRMMTQGEVKFTPRAVCFESQRRRFFTLEDGVEGYKEEIKTSERF